MDAIGAQCGRQRSAANFDPVNPVVIHLCGSVSFFAVHKVRLSQARSRATDRTVRPPVYIKVVQRACMSDIEPEQSVPVKVRRQPGDYRLATYRLDKVYRMRWDNVGGGIQQRSAIHVYGYVLCNELTCGKLAHSCRHGPPPPRDQGVHHQEAQRTGLGAHTSDRWAEAEALECMKIPAESSLR